MADASELILNQILGELQKLNDFEHQQNVEARNLLSVNQANQQTPESPSLARRLLDRYMPGAISSSASTPQIINQTQLAERANEELTQVQNQQRQSTSTNQGSGGQSGPGTGPSAEEAVAWSLLAESGIGGPLGRLKQAQYELNQYRTAAGGAAQVIQGRISNWGSSTDEEGNQTPGWGAKLAGGLAPVQSMVDWTQNHELTSTLGYLALRSGMRKLDPRDAYEAGAALGYGQPGRGAPAGLPWGQELWQSQAQAQGQRINELELQLHRGIAGYGGTGMGMRSQDVQQWLSQLTGQGYSLNTAGGLGASGNLADIAKGLAPAVLGMGQQGPEIVAQWTPALRSANDSIAGLRAMLEQVPAAAKNAQLGVQGFNQSMVEVAQSVEQLGGTQTEGGQMAINFEQMHPGLNPNLMASLIQNPIFQAFGLGQGVLPSGLSALPGNQLNSITNSTVGLMFNAFRGLAPQQQFHTLPNGQRVPMNDPEAIVAQQVASQLGISPQDALRLYRDRQNPQRQGAIGQIQQAWGQNFFGNDPRTGRPDPNATTGLQHLLGRSLGDSSQWTKLSPLERQSATQDWNRNIAPYLSQAGLSPDKIKKINSTTNIASRAYALQNDLQDLQGSGPGRPGNASTPVAQVEITLKGKANNIFNLNSPRRQANTKQNAGGQQLNITLNSPEGQNPLYQQPRGSDWMGQMVSP